MKFTHLYSTILKRHVYWQTVIKTHAINKVDCGIYKKGSRGIRFFLSTMLGISLFTSYASATTINTTTSNIADGTTESTVQNNIDPFENYNRNAFRMNMKIDRAVIRPTAQWYVDNVPDPVQYSTSDFFNNLRDFVTLGNDIIQLNGKWGISTFMRISINSTIGIFGIIDIATSIGLPAHKNTFGRTMKVYGWRQSSYFVIPLLGPSTVRDALGMIPDVYFNPTWLVFNNAYISVGLFTINAIDTRAKYLDTDKLLYTSLDPYITMRDFYLQSIGESSVSTNANNRSIDSILDEETESKAK